MIYLASPYSHPESAVRDHRYHDVMQCTAALMAQGIPAYSPIVHCHTIANKYNLPTDAKFWQAYNTAFIRKADAVYVCLINGWRESLGTQQEIGLAKELGIPVIHVDLQGVPVVA